MGATIGTRLHTWFAGSYVGKDAFGNRYYVQRRPEEGARPKRWVMYRGLAEPSKVPPLWHAWLHYTTDILPPDMNVTPYAWEKPHLPNLTGTKAACFPPGHAGQRAPSTSDYDAWFPQE